MANEIETKILNKLGVGAEGKAAKKATDDAATAAAAAEAEAAGLATGTDGAKVPSIAPKSGARKGA